MPASVTPPTTEFHKNAHGCIQTPRTKRESVAAETRAKEERRHGKLSKNENGEIDEKPSKWTTMTINRRRTNTQYYIIAIVR